MKTSARSTGITSKSFVSLHAQGNRSFGRSHLLDLVPVILIGALSIVSCGGGGVAESKAFVNSEWRAGVSESVEFPLSEPVQLRVGLSGGSAPTENNLSLAWLEEATNINLIFEVIPSSPGDVELGSIIRSGRLHDLITEGKLPLGDETNRQMLVDLREFAHLLPNTHALVEENRRFRHGLATKMTLENELYSIGSFDIDRPAFAGVLAYRRDLFEKHDLGFADWDELADALRRLKALYPDSSPLGGTPRDIYYVYPALFGSGMTQRQIVYYDVDRSDWVFGPAEPEFAEYVALFAELFSEGVLLPEIFTLTDSQAARYFASDTVFVAPYPGVVGPYFPYSGSGYGGVDESGEWNGTGTWIDVMPIPALDAGATGRISSDLYTSVGRGFNVYNQSDHVGEAIALLDFLYDPANALSVRFGPEGTIWRNGESGPELIAPYAQVYRSEGLQAVLDLAGSSGTPVGLPISGLLFSTPTSLFGQPQFPEYRYYVEQVIPTYPLGEAIPLDPGIRISQEEEFAYGRADLVVALESFVESQIAQFIIGQRSISEYDDFVAECDERGAAELLSLYRDNSGVFEGAIFE